MTTSLMKIGYNYSILRINKFTEIIVTICLVWPSTRTYSWITWHLDLQGGYHYPRRLNQATDITGTENKEEPTKLYTSTSYTLWDDLCTDSIIPNLTSTQSIVNWTRTTLIKSTELGGPPNPRGQEKVYWNSNRTMEKVASSYSKSSTIYLDHPRYSPPPQNWPVIEDKKKLSGKEPTSR